MRAIVPSSRPALSRALAGTAIALLFTTGAALAQAVDAASADCVAITSATSATAIASASVSDGEAARADKDAAKEATKAASIDTIAPGDRIKLSFYEMLQVQEDKWGADRQRLQAPAKGFQFRAELSGEYLVQEDGTITIPLLGTMLAKGDGGQDLQRKLQCAFGTVIGRKGLVNVLNIAKRPIYVVGPVKKSGTYEFAPGMTVLQAIALAGGLERLAVEPFQAAEVTRETEKLQIALERAVRMMARTAVLAAERNNEPASIPSEILDIAGTQKAATFMSEEANARKLDLLAIKNQQLALQANVDSAQIELKARRGRVELLKNSISLREQRVADLAQLANKGALGRPVMMQAQAELSDSEERLQETLTAISLAQEKLEKAQQDLNRLRLQGDISYQQELLSARMEAKKSLAESEGAANVTRSMIKTQNATPALQDLGLEIVRRSGDEVVALPAGETTLLQPGDVVQVGVKPDRSKFRPSASASSYVRSTATEN